MIRSVLLCVVCVVAVLVGSFPVGWCISSHSHSAAFRRVLDGSLSLSHSQSRSASQSDSQSLSLSHASCCSDKPSKEERREMGRWQTCVQGMMIQQDWSPNLDNLNREQETQLLKDVDDKMKNDVWVNSTPSKQKMWNRVNKLLDDATKLHILKGGVKNKLLERAKSLTACATKVKGALKKKNDQDTKVIAGIGRAADKKLTEITGVEDHFCENYIKGEKNENKDDQYAEALATKMCGVCSIM